MNILRKLINSFQSHIQNKFLRFIFVGVLNSAFGYGVYCLLILTGLSYIWATLISHILGVLFNFVTTGTIVFNNSDKKLLFRFILNYILVYFINIGINKCTQLLFGSNEYISGFVALVVTSLISFFILKRFVFNNKDKHEEN